MYKIERVSPDGKAERCTGYLKTKSTDLNKKEYVNVWLDFESKDKTATFTSYKSAVWHWHKYRETAPEATKEYRVRITEYEV